MHAVDLRVVCIVFPRRYNEREINTDIQEGSRKWCIVYLYIGSNSCAALYSGLWGKWTYLFIYVRPMIKNHSPVRITQSVLIKSLYSKYKNWFFSLSYFLPSFLSLFCPFFKPLIRFCFCVMRTNRKHYLLSVYLIINLLHFLEYFYYAKPFNVIKF
jgi:hypothetical protein